MMIQSSANTTTYINIHLKFIDTTPFVYSFYYMKIKYCCESVRLCRFLYSLGFDKESIMKDGKEQWLFERSPELQESLDFFFLF